MQNKQELDELLTYEEVVIRVHQEYVARFEQSKQYLVEIKLPLGVPEKLLQDKLNPYAGINAFGGGTDGD